MKTAFGVMVLIAAVLICGCTAPAQQQTPATVPAAATPAPVPNLIGTWSGPTAGYLDGKGFSDFGGMQVIMKITDQKDRIFSGQMFFRMKDGSEQNETFAGVIGLDGKSLTIIEQNGGQDTGTITGENDLELIYLDHSLPYSIAIDWLKRS